MKELGGGGREQQAGDFLVSCRTEEEWAEVGAELGGECGRGHQVTLSLILEAWEWLWLSGLSSHLGQKGVVICGHLLCVSPSLEVPCAWVGGSYP